MKLYSSYWKKIRHYNRIFQATIEAYRAAVDFFVSACLARWDDVSAVSGSQNRMRFVETLTVETKMRPAVPFPFADADPRFYKFPSYLRRAAINEAVGNVSSYQSRMAEWNAHPDGRQPGLPKAGRAFPCLYRDNMYRDEDAYQAQVKVHVRNTWDWVTVSLRRSDVDYIQRHCAGQKECAPVLMNKGKQWFLAFSYEQEVTLPKKPVSEQTILAVDLGINNACVCAAMCADGTVLAREFLSLARENDCLQHKVNHIKRAQCHGSRQLKNLWAYANGVNRDIAVKTARFIVETAVSCHADVVVFEHLDCGKKKRGSKRQRFHLWKARAVQSIVTDRTHRLGIRVSTVNAWGTSRMAYDGSGRVVRGIGGNYSICRFPTGKMYHCDLNAAYNIGARYFVRELLKSLPATEGQRIRAKIPGCARRSTCTLATLINLDAELPAPVA